MMNREKFLALWDHLRTLHGITLRLVEALPDDKIDATPIPNMRSPKALVFHFCGQLMRDTAKGLISGEIRQEDEAAMAAIRTKADLVKFVNDCWTEADAAIQKVTDAHFTATVKTPWNFDMPGAMAWTIIGDEYLHHRGQLFAFVRALGADVPMMWDTAHNALPYRPKATATV